MNGSIDFQTIGLFGLLLLWIFLMRRGGIGA